MIYGNSRGNNKNKHYLTKKNKLTSEQNIEKANEFLNWFKLNQDFLINQEIRRNNYNHDVFTDTLLKMYNKILYNAQINDYRGYFSRAYYTNTFQYNCLKSKENALNQSIENDIQETIENDIEETNRTQLKQFNTDELIETIFEYVKEHYTIQEFSLWKIYSVMKPHISYNKLSQITNLSMQQISSTISKIKEDIKTNQELITKRKKLLSL
ncbi:hypothetical protein EZS27_004669 [termite gut metagenome]|uniref:Uncharacterized protein n=1 Tax=termite gut metagenome TaxID=433724 RepID=A0A5J4SNT7_9ZZZZ